jgi:single-stranded-DNA-specific exonuclease
MARRWRYPNHDQALIGQLASGLRVAPILAAVMASRDVTTVEAGAGFLESKLTELHEPDLLPGVAEAADRIVAAIRAGRRITVYGDYDVDGVSATALLWHCLRLAGATADYYIPHRLDEGYGLHADALRSMAKDHPGQLVVTVDCGIASADEADVAREVGLELIVTDHHNFGSRLPNAAAVCHPRLPGTSYPFGDLCGAGVAFKLAWAICQRLGEGRRATPRMKDFLMSAVGLAALGTVADCVPLLGENRVLVRYGLASLRDKATVGLKALLQSGGLWEKPGLQAEDIAFTVGPRINAAGRLGQARLAVELLTTDSAERALSLANYLDEQNKIRQTVERRILKQAREQIEKHPEWLDDSALVLAENDWHPGVVGIVASRIVEQFQKPAVLIAINTEDGLGQGSARTFGRFDLHAALTACSEQLVTYGGHQAAAGLRIRSGDIELFRQRFAAYAAEHHRPTEDDTDLGIDAEIRLADLSVHSVKELERLGPFGRDNKRPVFVTSGVRLAEPPKKMGEGERHLALRLTHYGATLRAVSFGNGEWASEIAACEEFEVCYQPQINAFRGHESVELRLLDWRKPRVPAPVS